jgi:hypothetical protein
MIDRSRSELNEAVVRRFYRELWDEKKRELLDPLVAEDLRFRASMGAIINGRAAFGRYIDTVHTAFPDCAIRSTNFLRWTIGSSQG